MKRFMALLIMLVLYVSVAYADFSSYTTEKVNRYFFRTGIVIDNSNCDFAVCVDYTGEQWQIPHGNDWRIGEVCTLWLFQGKKDRGVYDAIHGGFTNMTAWEKDENALDVKCFELVTDDDYYPIDYYPVTVIINENGNGIDYNGKEWKMPATFAVNDVVTCWVWYNGTNCMNDDIIVRATYSGHAENFFRNF